MCAGQDAHGRTAFCAALNCAVVARQAPADTVAIVLALRERGTSLPHVVEACQRERECVYGRSARGVKRRRMQAHMIEQQCASLSVHPSACALFHAVTEAS